MKWVVGFFAMLYVGSSLALLARLLAHPGVVIQ